MKLNDYQQDLYDNWVVKTHYIKMLEKTTICAIKLENGFEIVGTSGCVNPKNYDAEIGKHFALVDAIQKLNEFVGFFRQENGL